MPHRVIKQIKPVEAKDLASIAQARLAAEQMITQERERSVRLFQERKQTAQAEPLAIRSEGSR